MGFSSVLPGPRREDSRPRHDCGTKEDKTGMPLLIDEIRGRLERCTTDIESRSGHKGFDRDAAVRQVRFLASDIAEVTGRSIVRATNIREYLSREWGGRQFDYDSMECCMPPFPLVWVEWTGTKCEADGGRIGVMVNSQWQKDKDGYDQWLLRMQVAGLN